MAITLNHTIVPAHDKTASAQFFAQIFGLTCAEPLGTCARRLSGPTLPASASIASAIALQELERQLAFEAANLLALYRAKCARAGRLR